MTKKHVPADTDAGTDSTDTGETTSSGTTVKTAVALQYEQGKDPAPRVTAKGKGEAAERIIELAREHDIVVEGNPALAEALSQVELDEFVPENLFTAVASVISFVLQTAEKKRKNQPSSPPHREGDSV